MNIKGIIKKILGGVEDKKKHELQWLEQHGFKHGENFNFYSGYPVDANFPWLISVGDHVTLATDVKLLAHDASTSFTGAKTKIGIVEIGSNVFIGAKTVVLCNTRIGDQVVVGANSVVTHDLPSNGVYAGNPAKFICTFDEYKEKHMKYRESRPIFSEKRWYEWIDASEEDWESMREKLKDGFGYL